MLQNIVNEKPDAILEDPSIKMMLQILVQYYEGGQWLQDYELDEKGCFPKDLKRGVLSEDGLWNLLTEWKEMESQRIIRR